MLSYGSWVAGVDVGGQHWVHSFSASSLLADTFSVLRLKRDLDRGVLEASGTLHPGFLGRVALTSPGEHHQALEQARAALPAWSARPLQERLEVIEHVHAALVERRHEVVERLVEEGHPRRLARWEVSGFLTAASPEAFAVSSSLVRTAHVDASGREVVVERKADGVVGFIPPNNAAASSSILALGVIAGGNCVVIKVPRSSPLATAWIWREVVLPVLEEQGVPRGVVSIICSDPRDVIDAWLAPGGVDDVFYVGGSERGLALGLRAYAAGKKAVLELAGNDSLLVWEGADVRGAAHAAAECFYGSAQICMVPKRVVVHPSLADEFLAELVAAASQVRPGDPGDEATLLSPVLHAQDFADVLAEASAHGADLLCGGHRLATDGTEDPTGVFLAPTVLRLERNPSAPAPVPAVRALEEETFYPLLPVLVWNTSDSEDPLASVMADLEANAYGLRNSLWTSDPRAIRAFKAMRGGGLLKVNDSHIGFHTHMPSHGGTGLTGGPYGEANYPLLTTTHLQGVSDATNVTDRASVFDVAPYFS
jgi:acyl-CoA reductase-like NAD-dependent aldehyde dehydrogenase